MCHISIGYTHDLGDSIISVSFCISFLKNLLPNFPCLQYIGMSLHNHLCNQHRVLATRYSDHSLARKHTLPLKNTTLIAN